MPYSTLEKKLRMVPESEFDFVSRFLDLVLSRNSNTAPAKAKAKKTEKKSIRQLGQWKGKVWIADDFDETPDCFKEYV
ncbi:MAG: DUF2281 domain-containing protein [Treponema sp.]|nr:DUF2281 domain-containing protein [Treponema sp.]MBQ7619969.1 DUF2281 domain-containing protein [Treponema sp.]